jgi:hypothetical protein
VGAGVKGRGRGTEGGEGREGEGGEGSWPPHFQNRADAAANVGHSETEFHRNENSNF